jgi:hypothetical protein
LRFQNKTDRAVVLAYVDHSGVAVDDRGNRSIPWGPNAYRGIGLVAGTTFDPKLVIRPSGSADAQFELVQQGTPQLTGLTYVLDLTVSQIMPAEGHQFTLGGEFPLHFEGLANGSASAVPNLAVPVSASDAVASLKGIFGRKKTVQNVSAAATTATNSVAAINATATPSASSAPSTGAAAAPPHSVANSAGNAPQPASSVAVSAAPATRSGNATPASAQSAEPWSPPTDAAAENASLADPLKLPDVPKMPDVVGVRLGMTLPQALQVLHGQYPGHMFQEIPANYIPNMKLDYGFNILTQDARHLTEAVVSLTAPPGHQVVWHIVRYGHGIHASHANVLAALRAKYGKESFAGAENGSKVTDERIIGTLFWIFDEHGNRAPMPSSEAFGSNDISFCLGRTPDAGPRMATDEVRDPNWCQSFVGVIARLDPRDIVENTMVDMMDLRLANRTANAYVAWQRDAATRAHAAELEKAKKNKPSF